MSRARRGDEAAFGWLVEAHAQVAAQRDAGRIPLPAPLFEHPRMNKFMREVFETVAYGKSDEDGHKVADGEIGAGDLFATIFTALGIDPHTEYFVGARPIPLADFGAKPVKDVLA